MRERASAKSLNLSGPASYCGPWLAEQIDGIARDIRSDFYPQISREVTIRDCERIRIDAEETAASKIAAAERQAAALLKQASKDAESYRGSMADAARTVLRVLHG